MWQELRCRLCLAQYAISRIDLFKENSGYIYSNTMRETMHIELADTAGMPRYACDNCISRVRRFLKFRKLILKNEKKLRSEFKKKESAKKDLKDASPEPVMVEEVSNQGQHPSKQEVILPEATPFDDIAQLPDPEDCIAVGAPEPEPNLQENKDDLDTKTDQDSIANADPVLNNHEPTFADDVSMGAAPSPTPSSIVDDTEPAPDTAPTAFSHHDSESDEWPTEDEKATKIKAPKRKRKKVADPKPTQESLTDVTSVLKLNGRITDEEQKLETHMIEMGWFICKDCGEDCKNITQLRVHLKENHKGNPKDYELCCNKKMRSLSLSLMYDHIRWHLDKTGAFQCKICGASFKSSQNLLIHDALHDPPAFVCEICGYGFDSAYKVKKHVFRSHEKSKCTFCGVEMNNGSLNNHIKRYHSTDINYLCDICGQGYAELTLLKTHRMDHTALPGSRVKKKKINAPKKHAFDADYFK